MGNKKQKIFVAMSGGVDSSVAAALLKKHGYKITGVFMRLGKKDKVAESAAKNVAKKLGIDFLVWDFRKEFKKAVIDYFLRELKAGHTPNPCVVCNSQIKFGLFLDKALKLGADFVATGHYAKIKLKTQSSKFPPASPCEAWRVGKAATQNSKPKYQLFTAKDKIKDQSYFLYRLNQRQLSKIIFPIGDYQKSEVIKLAKKWRLPYQHKQSFDICFIDDYQKFFKKYLKLKMGKIVGFVKTRPHRLSLPDGGGEKKRMVFGEHKGLPFYTIGQRAGIGGPGPFYVTDKDVKKNILYVSNNRRDFLQKEILVEKVNWIGGQAPKLPLSCKVRIRYRSEAAEAQISKQKTVNSKQLEIQFKHPQRAITPGQSAVFYGKKGEVLCWGII